MQTTGASALDRAAEYWGVEREFWDIWGKHHETPPETERRVLESLGVETGSEEEIAEALEKEQQRRWAPALPPTIVANAAAPIELPVQVPQELANANAAIEIHLENGMSLRFDAALGQAPVANECTIGKRRFVRKRVPVAGELAPGYHTVSIRIGQVSWEARLIVGQERAYEPEWLAGRRTAGIGVSLYALRSEQNWGCGDFTDLETFADWAAKELGVTFIGLNPLHSIPNRQPFNTSPYLPNCSFYRNFIYLDIERVEDYSRSRAAQRLMRSARLQEELRSLRASPLVEYERVSRLKQCFLRALFGAFLRDEFPHNTPRARDFRAYVEREGDLLHRFAVHAVLDETFHRRNADVWNWAGWPDAYRKPESAATRDFAEKHWRSVLFHKYVQWQVDEQLARAQQYAKKRGLRIGLYHDLALATDRFGCDLWAHRDFYVAGCRVGSPPDNFAPKGQDWAFPPPNASRHYMDGYRLFAESIRKSCQHGGALRIDHVMRFFRLFWIPDGMEAPEGTYVRERFEDLLRILALESWRNRVIVVGEDLGTVPDFIRDTLSKFGILSYRVFYFEHAANGGFRPPAEYPRQALVSVSTHDLPTLAGFWVNRDIEARRAAGTLPDEESYQRMKNDRVRDKQKMLDVLFETGFLPDYVPRNATEIPELTGELHNAVVGFLACTPSEMMILNQEDLFKDIEQQNLPGTTAEHPNWRRKMRFRIEELATDSFARDCTAMYRSWIDRTGRGRAVS